MASKIRVLLTNSYPSVGVELLKSKNYSIRQWNSVMRMPREKLLKEVVDVDALWCVQLDSIDSELINSAKKLKVVATYSVGIDHIDQSALKQHGIRLGHTPGVLTDACADFTVGLTLMTMRRMSEGVEGVKQGDWSDWRLGKSIFGSKIGLVGLGRIGQAVASRLKYFSPIDISYNSRTRKKNIEGDLDILWKPNLVDLAKDSDVLIVCCDLNPDTRGLISKSLMSLMKPSSFLISTSRDEIVDFSGLAELLERGHFGGVGIDLTCSTPFPTDHPILKYKRCVVLPHMAAACQTTCDVMSRISAENIIGAFEGTGMHSEFKL